MKVITHDRALSLSRGNSRHLPSPRQFQTQKNKILRNSWQRLAKKMPRYRAMRMKMTSCSYYYWQATSYGYKLWHIGDRPEVTDTIIHGWLVRWRREQIRPQLYHSCRFRFDFAFHFGFEQLDNTWVKTCSH